MRDDRHLDYQWEHIFVVDKSMYLSDMAQIRKFPFTILVNVNLFVEIRVLSAGNLYQTLLFLNDLSVQKGPDQWRKWSSTCACVVVHPALGGNQSVLRFGNIEQIPVDLFPSAKINFSLEIILWPPFVELATCVPHLKHQFYRCLRVLVSPEEDMLVWVNTGWKLNWN